MANVGGKEVKQHVTYCSKAMPAGVIQDTCRKVKDLIKTGQELEANILLLRSASKRRFKGVRG